MNIQTFWQRSTGEIITFTEGSLFDIIQLARKDILSLIATIESLQEQMNTHIRGNEEVKRLQLLDLQDKQKLIESQKEEITDLKIQYEKLKALYLNS